jgi:hypothetical protein
VELIKSKVELMRGLGVRDEDLVSMVQRDLAAAERIALAVDVLQRHWEQGTITRASIDAPPRWHDGPEAS